MSVITTAALPDHSLLLEDVAGAPATSRTAGPDRVLVVVPTKGRPERVRRQVGSLPVHYDALLLATVPEDLPEGLPDRPGLQQRIGPYPSAGRTFTTPHPDLAAKRNSGLSAAREGGYGAVVFIDDDVDVTAADLLAMVAALDGYTIVGRRSVGVADHSMLYKVLGRASLVTPFVSGNCLAVRTGYAGVFPDIYNEDWFFMWPALCRREVGRLGDVRQVAVDEGTRDPAKRAAAEEVGDVLAEGFFRGLHELPPAARPEKAGPAVRSEQFWSRALYRRAFLYELARTVLANFPDDGDGASADADAVRIGLQAGQDILAGLSARELAASAAELCDSAASGSDGGRERQLASPSPVGG
ncbi:hypothetical protein ACWF94_05365 [Streptomyces sp. NPDC055078]